MGGRLMTELLLMAVGAGRSEDRQTRTARSLIAFQPSIRRLSKNGERRARPAS